ncbi:MAG: sensor histidine kinase [Chloroflexi bacterium]|nr:sensor histidine kinase [Chloroflexota bacterium]
MLRTVDKGINGTARLGKRLERRKAAAGRTFGSLSRQQLLVYAGEVAQHFREELSLRQAVSGREQRIQELVASSTAAQEEERQWIACEVHDRIAQTLASVFQQLQTIESLTHGRPEVRQVAVRASALVRDAIREARNIMNELHPPLLDEYGIVPLIEEELRRFEGDTGCTARLIADCPARPPQAVEVALYRIFHEALINVRRHATGARAVEVALVCNNGFVDLRLRDDGAGFDAQAASSSRRVGGLMSMRRRVEIVGGSFEIRSQPGQGTEVSVRVPVNGITKGG